jgi:hypothetical protein
LAFRLKNYALPARLKRRDFLFSQFDKPPRLAYSYAKHQE